MKLFGIIKDAENDMPLRGAKISLFVGENKLAAIKSDNEGKFEYKETASYIGELLVCKVEKEKYRPQDVSYKIEQEEIHLDIELVPQPSNFRMKFLHSLIQFLRRRWQIIAGVVAAVIIIAVALIIFFAKAEVPKIDETVEEVVSVEVATKEEKVPDLIIEPFQKENTLFANIKNEGKDAAKEFIVAIVELRDKNGSEYNKFSTLPNGRIKNLTPSDVERFKKLFKEKKLSAEIPTKILEPGDEKKLDWSSTPPPEYQFFARPEKTVNVFIFYADFDDRIVEENEMNNIALIRLGKK